MQLGEVPPVVVETDQARLAQSRDAGSARGRGLGLAVVRTLTEAQGGRVQLTTGASGTRVAISLRPAT